MDLSLILELFDLSFVIAVFVENVKGVSDVLKKLLVIRKSLLETHLQCGISILDVDFLVVKDGRHCPPLAVAEEQAASSREIAAGIDNVTKATTEILEHLEGIKTSMDETAAVAARTAKLSDDQAQIAQDLRDSLAMFKIAEEDEGMKAIATKAQGK